MRFKLIASLYLFLSVFCLELNSKALAQTSLNYKNVEEKVSSFLLANQRSEALRLVDENLKNLNLPKDEKISLSLRNLKFKVLSLFLDSRAQDAFETAAAHLFDEKQKANQNIQECLKIESENINCLWLELKFIKKYKPDQFAEKANMYLELTQMIPQLYANQTSIRYILGDKEPLIEKKVSLNYLDENQIQLLKLEELIQTKKLKEAILFYDKIKTKLKDSPDHLYFDYKIEELKISQSSEILTNPYANYEKIYIKKCKELSLLVVRKYFNDISFCSRG